MKHVILDLETLGVQAGCMILQIGACVLDANETFDVTINRFSSQQAGFTYEDDTLEWWNRQDEQVRDQVFSGKTPIGEALMRFGIWLDLVAGANKDDLCIWGKGCDFDNVILGAAYAKLGLALPWQFRNNRCLRTFMALFPHVGGARSDIPHLALEDAKAEKETLKLLFYALEDAAHAVAILRETPST